MIRTLLVLAALFATACATTSVGNERIIARVDRTNADAVAWSLLLRIPRHPQLSAMHRDYRARKESITIRLVERHDRSEQRDVFQVRFVEERGGTSVYADGWHEDDLRRRVPDDGHVEAQVASVLELMSPGGTLRIARAD